MSLLETVSKSVPSKEDRFWFFLDDLLQFIFPENLQHPLAAPRLFIFGMYGPLDAHGQLRSGIKGSHVLSEYELETMCEQIEREDIVLVYVPKGKGMGMLLNHEQDSLIAQADSKLKIAKGKAMTPQMTREDVIALFKDFRLDGQGRINFHETQLFLEKYRRDRILDFKKVFPSLTSNSVARATPPPPTTFRVPTMSAAHVPKHVVSTAVAPTTMFVRAQGNTNADLIEKNAKMFGKHGFQITTSDSGQYAEVIQNVKLLRDVAPKFENPYEHSRPRWNELAGSKGTSIGSGVKGIGSSTTWRPKFTSY